MLAKGSVRSLLSGMCGHLDLLVGKPGRPCPLRLLWRQSIPEVSSCGWQSCVVSLYHHTCCPTLPHGSRTGVADIEWEPGSTWGPLQGDRKPRACLCSPRCPRDALSPEQRVRTLGGCYAPVYLSNFLPEYDLVCPSSQTLEGLSCHDVQGSQPRVKREQESHLGSAGMEHVPDHRGVGREAGTLTQKPAGISSDSGSGFRPVVRAFPVSIKPCSVSVGTDRGLFGLLKMFVVVGFFL